MDRRAEDCLEASAIARAHPRTGEGRGVDVSDPWIGGDHVLRSRVRTDFQGGWHLQPSRIGSGSDRHQLADHFPRPCAQLSHRHHGNPGAECLLMLWPCKGNWNRIRHVYLRFLVLLRGVEELRSSTWSLKAWRMEYWLHTFSTFFWNAFSSSLPPQNPGLSLFQLLLLRSKGGLDSLTRAHSGETVGLTR